MTERLLGFPLVFAKKAPQPRDLKRFMNLEPFVPLCQFVGQWVNRNPNWGTDEDTMLYRDSFCTLLRPSNSFLSKPIASDGWEAA